MTTPEPHPFSRARATNAARSAVAYAARQPSWVFRVVAVATVLTVLALLLVLLVPAMIVGTIVFAILALYTRVQGWLGLRTASPKNEGRENVRVRRKGP